MTIPRSTLTYNLNTISQTPDNNGFDIDYADYLIPTDQATTKSAKEVIINTFKQAADLEDTKKRIWIERNNQAESLGHLIHEKAGILPDELQELFLKDEVHDLLKVEVIPAGGTSYTVYVEESSLKKCQFFNDMLDDLPEGDMIPITDLGLTKHQLDLAFNFMKRGDLPSDLNMGDCLALLRFANYLDHCEFIEALLNRLANIPLEKEALVTLPHELGVQWAKSRPPEESATILACFKGQDSFIQDIGIELINNGHLDISHFKNFDELKGAVDVSRIKVLKLSNTRGFSSSEFKKIVKACPELLSLQADYNFTDQHLVHIKTLSNLQTLNLGLCYQISDEGLQHLEKLSNLQTLDLRGCQTITNVGLEHLKGLSSLKTLNLGNCLNIADSGLEHLKELINLQTLDLANCRLITNDGLAHLKGLSSLETLNLGKCPNITDSGLEHLKELKNLQTLDLGWCSITDAGLEHLQKLPNLQNLDLRGSQNISDGGLEHLKTLKKLHILNLSGCNQITSSGLAHLNKLSNLLTLNLTRCSKVKDSALEQLKELSNLQTLNLTWCGFITDIGLVHLKELSNLQSLNLAYCKKITDLGLIHLKELPNLQNLDLSGCMNITDNALKELKLHLPILKILPQQSASAIPLF